MIIFIQLDNITNQSHANHKFLVFMIDKKILMTIGHMLKVSAGYLGPKISDSIEIVSFL